MITRAERALEARDFGAAIDAYGQALERTPWNTRIQTALVRAHVARARERSATGTLEGYADAERDLREALARAPEQAELRTSLAAVLLDRAALEPDAGRAAELRAAAEELDAALVERTPARRLAVERRLDLALELVERGQLAAAVQRLERIHADHPEHAEAARLLAQVRVREGIAASERNQHAAAGESFGRAVQLYAALAPCDGERCDADELAQAHQNHIVAWLNARRPGEAESALRDAEADGLRFPRLRAALADVAP